MSFAAAASAFPPGKVVVTGNPVRPELFAGDRARGATGFGLDPGAPLVYVTGGALGSHRINRVVGEALPRLLAAAQCVHQCGENPHDDAGWLAGQAAALPEALRARYRVLPFVSEGLADLYAAAALVVGRAGGGTVTELAALGLPSVLIPLPGARGDEQTANARVLADAGAAVLLPERELTADRLMGLLGELLGDPARLAPDGRARPEPRAPRRRRAAGRPGARAGRPPVKRVCVFCGSSAGTRPEYAEAAGTLARELVRRGLGLVYGGGSVGLMGILADAALAEGGQVIGVIPRGLARKELLHTGLTELRVVESMHERKATMAELADAFVALPGGLGTLEETLEVLTWSQLGIRRKPVALLNVRGYWDALLELLGRAVEEGFVRREYLGLLLTGEAPEELLERLTTWRAPGLPQAWLDSREL